MKPKACLACLLILFILLTAVTACAKRGDQEESQPASETSPSTSRTQVTTKETESSPVETETEPSETQESDPSESADPSSEATTQVTSTSSTASTMTLPSYTVTVTTPQATTTVATTIQDLSKEYEAIYKDYAGRLRSKTPVLIKEYKEEAKANTRGFIGLMDIRTQKTAALTLIQAEGTAEMTSLRLRTNGNAADPAFDTWSGELTKVYRAERDKLRAAFD